MSDLRSMFRDKSVSADDILRALTVEQLLAGKKKAEEMIAWLEAEHEAFGHPDVLGPDSGPFDHEPEYGEFGKLHTPQAGAAFLEQMHHRLCLPYRVALNDTNAELERRRGTGRAPPPTVKDDAKTWTQENPFRMREP